MDDADWLGPWDPSQEFALRIFTHFVVSRTENSKAAVLHDAMLPLAGALVGLDASQSVKWYWKAGGMGLPVSIIRSDLLAECLARFERAAETRINNVIASNTFSLSEHRTFSQSLREEGKYRIDVWLPASAACAYLALYIAHLGLVFYLEERGAPDPEIAAARERTDHFLLVMRMAAQAVADGGTSVLQDFDIKPALPQALQSGLDMFVAAVCFNVFHELGHILLGDHEESASSASVDKHAREFRADQFALTFVAGLDLATPNVTVMGALIALVSSSMMTPGPDSASSKTHPSLPDRYERLCTYYDEGCGREAGTTRRGYELYLSNVLVNLFDRDRCPCWLGRDQRAVLGVPPDFEFDDKRIDYKSAGKTRMVDLSRAPTRTRKLDISED